MKKVLISLVLIWFASITRVVIAKAPTNPDMVIESIYIKETTISPVAEDDYEEENDNQKEDVKMSESSKKEDLPRLKRIYLGAYGGYFYTKENNFEFTPTNNCNPSYNFICNDDDSLNPIKAEANDEYFLMASFGINSENPIRLEFNYYKMGKELELKGQNQVNLNTINYDGQIDLEGGSANIYFDFILNRRKPTFIFTPYAMAGIGITDIDVGDITFKGKDNSNVVINGKSQRNKTIIYGAGLTAGINNYISLDIGYRYYDFGKIKTSNIMSVSSTDDTDPDNPIDTTEDYDLELESDFDAHVAIIGLKIQI
ncbi:porin family protein [bacterium]|nr:porin family protein [bacterium]